MTPVVDSQKHCASIGVRGADILIYNCKGGDYDRRNSEGRRRAETTTRKK